MTWIARLIGRMPQPAGSDPFEARLSRLATEGGARRTIGLFRRPR